MTNIAISPRCPAFVGLFRPSSWGGFPQLLPSLSSQILFANLPTFTHSLADAQLAGIRGIVPDSTGNTDIIGGTLGGATASISTTPGHLNATDRR